MGSEWRSNRKLTGSTPGRTTIHEGREGT